MGAFWWLRPLTRKFVPSKQVLVLPIALLFVIMTLTQRFDEDSRDKGMLPLAFNTNDRLSEKGAGEEFKFKNFKVDQWNSSQKVILGEDTEPHFQEVGDHQCYILGTDFQRSSKGCVCLSGFFGPHCGVPRSAWESHYKKNPKSLAKLTPRKIPRRLIHGLQVNHEFDLFEARLETLKGVVDVYLMLESNYSSYGESKPLFFLEKLQEGWLASHQSSLLYIFLPFFPKAGEANGWYADAFLRLFLGKSGMRLLENVREDDIFLLLDADELPNKESLLFLKLFDGWTEPVKFGFRWTVFGFFWLKAEDPSWLASLPLVGGLVPKAKERLLTLYVACTVGMLSQMYGNNAMLLRRNVWSHSLLKDRLENYTRTHPKPEEWQLGNSPNYAGHHCSWCFSPTGIRTKLSSAQRDDKPRWGNFPEKLELSYIENLIRTGGWFDGEHPFLDVADQALDDEVYAPEFFRSQRERFGYLLNRP